MSMIDANSTLASEVAVRELQQRLHSTRRSLVGLRIAVGAGVLLTCGAVFLAMSAITDWKIELPIVWRAGWLFAMVAGLLLAGVVGWQRWISAYTLSDAAVDAEGRLSQFGQRLRTTLDYEQQGPKPALASAALLASLHKDTRTLADQTEWSEAVNWRPLYGSLGVLCTVAIGWIATLVLIPEWRIAAARSVLLPVEYTTVTYTPQAITIRPGESVAVTAGIAGRPVTSAVLRHRPSGSLSEWTTVDLEPADQAEGAKRLPLLGDLSVTLVELTQDVEFEVVAGPRALPLGSIRVLQPLTLQKSEALIAPPSYTGRNNETVTTLDLKVLEGSTVELKLEFNRAAVDAKLLRVRQKKSADETTADAGPVEIPLVIHDTTAVVTLPDLRHSSSFTLAARTGDGMLLDPVPVNIRVQLDRKPNVQFIEPPEELVVTSTTEVPIVVEADDDLGLHKVGVMVQMGSGSMQTLLEESPDGSVLSYRLSTLLMLEDHQLTYQDAVTYYAFAEDNYFGQPRRTTTPLRFIDIRPFKLTFQVVDQQGSGSSGGSSVSLEELILRQRQGLSQAFQASQQPLSRDTMSQLSEREEELIDATNEFVAGMARLGVDLTVLREAVAQMETAIEALDTMKLPVAISAEEKALAALIRARENLRQKLNQSNSQSASACRKFDREFRQKLRMPEKKKSEQQQVAQTRQKLDELAKRERKWAQQASQCNNPSSSGSPSASKSSSQASKMPQDSPPNSDEKPSAPSSAEVAAKQEQIQSEFADLQKELDKLKAAGQAAREQARQAAASMQQGLDELKNENGTAAAREGERSAKQLEQLSAHLAAMNARDFGQRLDQAAQLAQQLASRQASLEKQLSTGRDAKPGKSPELDESDSDGQSGSKTTLEQGDRSKQLAREQRALSTETELLADLLDRLQRDSDTEPGNVKQKLEQAQAENPPREIAEGMQQTAKDLQGPRTASAARGATHARERLQELSKSLAAARQDYAQPQLKELMALEEQLAHLQDQMKRLQDNGQDPRTAQNVQPTLSRLEKLAAADARLAEALRRLVEGSDQQKQGSSNGGEQPPKPNSQIRPVENPNGQPMPEGCYSWLELGDLPRMREVSKVLQTRIQEAILAAALMDADQPVPPAYRELVEKYYRALSDDLR